MSTCCCMGPQNGEPLCPCRMAASRLSSTFEVPKPYTGEKQATVPNAEFQSAMRQLAVALGDPTLFWTSDEYGMETALIRCATNRIIENNVEEMRRENRANAKIAAEELAKTVWRCSSYISEGDGGFYTDTKYAYSKAEMLTYKDRGYTCTPLEDE